MRRLRVSRLQALSMEAAPGAYAMAGFNADLIKARRLVATLNRGIYQWSGFNAILSKQKYLLTATRGTFAMTGNAVTFTQASVPSITTAPVILGTPTVGSAVSYSAGTVLGTPTPTRTQQWIRDAADISGATSSTYTPISTDAAHQLSVRQIETNSFGVATRTSATVTIAAAPSGNANLLADWTARSTATGVVQAIRFNSSAVITNNRHINGTESNVVQNATGGIIGDGCLRINVPPSAGSDSGSWRVPMNASWSSDGQGFAATRHYVQYRLKLGPNRLTPSVGGGGFKFMNIAEYRFSSPNSSVSHTACEVVANNQNWRGILFAYREHPISGTTGFDTTDGSGNIHLQTAVDNGASISDVNSRYCLYQSGNASSGCWFFAEQEWITVYIVLRIQDYGGAGTGNEFDLYVARDGETAYSHLFNNRDFRIGSDSTVPNGNNGIWFLPYDTNRTSSSLTTYQEYDQLIVSTQPIAIPAPSTPAWLTAQIGGWQQISGTALSSVDPSPTPLGTSPQQGKVVPWTSFSVDTRDSSVYTAANGGHQDYAGNEVDKLSLNTTTPAWAQLRAPTPNGQISLDVNYYGDGRPTSKHSYYGQTVDEAGNRLMTWGGARWGVGNFVTNVDSFRLSDNDWNAGGTHANVPSGISGGGSVYAFAIQRDPRNGDVYALGNFSVARWTRASNTWTTRINGSGPFNNDAANAFDSTRNRIFVLGGDSGGASYLYNVDANTTQTVTRTGSEAANVMGSGNGMEYVPLLDAYLLRKSGSGGTVYKIDASTFACTLYATTGGSGIPGIVNGNGCYGKWRHVPKLGLMVYVPEQTSNVWVLRLV